MECWNVGIVEEKLEYWNVGIMEQWNIAYVSS